MSRLSRWITMTVVALALPAFAHTLGQEEKGAFTATVKFRVQDEKKGVDEPKKAANEDGAKRAAADAKRTDIIAKAFRIVQRKVAEQPQAARAEMKQAVAVAAMKLGDDELDPMAAQWLQQFTPMVRTELHLLLSVSEATPAQRKSIGAFRNKVARESSKLYAQSQQRIGKFQNTNTYPQPRNLVQESLTTLAATVLSAEQIERYKAEVKKRAEEHTALAIKNIVVKMDQDMVLSSEQRDKLEVALIKNWNASWCPSLESFMYSDQYFPAIPDNVVVPLLNAKQASVWKGTQRNNGMVFGGFGMFNGMEVDDDFPDDEKVVEPKKAAADLGQVVRRLFPRFAQVRAFQLIAPRLVAPVAVPVEEAKVAKPEVVKDLQKVVPKS